MGRENEIGWNREKYDNDRHVRMFYSEWVEDDYWTESIPIAIENDGTIRHVCLWFGQEIHLAVFRQTEEGWRDSISVVLWDDDGIRFSDYVEEQDCDGYHRYGITRVWPVDGPILGQIRSYVYPDFSESEPEMIGNLYDTDVFIINERMEEWL